MIYNLDSYDITLYNEFLENLKNHNIPFYEYVNIRDYRFYLETQDAPFILNYKEIQKSSRMFLVSKVKGVNSQDIYTYRRKKVSNTKDNLDLCYNDAYNYFLNKKSKYFYFIHIPNKEKSELLSKDLGRLYFFGNYFNSKYKIYLTDNQYTTQFIDSEYILVGGEDLIDLEVRLNYEVLLLKDRIKKFSQTPYRENGTTILPKYVDPFFKKTITTNQNSQ